MTINREDVIRVTKELLTENGEDYVYPGANEGQCQYAPQIVPITTYDAKYDDEVETGEYGHVPGCLVGQIVERLNPEAYDELIHFERGDLDFSSVADFSNAHRVAVDPFVGESISVAVRESWLNRRAIIDTGDDAELTAAMMKAQSLQDAGNTWGTAVGAILALEV